MKIKIGLDKKYKKDFAMCCIPKYNTCYLSKGTFRNERKDFWVEMIKYSNFLEWFCGCLEHECLHIILYNFIGLNASKKMDNLKMAKNKNGIIIFNNKIIDDFYITLIRTKIGRMLYEMS